MSVFENMAYGLKIRGFAKDDIRARVDRAAEILELGPLLERKPRAALRRAAAAGGDGPGDRARAGGVPVRRAAVEPRRQAARADALRDPEAAPAPGDHQPVRDPRPGRGDDAGPAHDRDERGTGRADRHADGGLREPGDAVRRRLHRLAGDELHPGQRRGRRALRAARRRARDAARGGAADGRARSRSASGPSTCRRLPARRDAAARSRWSSSSAPTRWSTSATAPRPSSRAWPAASVLSRRHHAPRRATRPGSSCSTAPPAPASDDRSIAACLALSATVRAPRRRQARAREHADRDARRPRPRLPMVEFDVKLAADNVSFLLHDATLERTTSGRGRADALPWRELSRLDAGGWHSAKYAGEMLPTFAAIARWARAHGVACNVEIKPTPGRERETGAAVALDAAALWRDAEVPPLLSSFAEDALAAARDAVPGLPRALLLDELPARLARAPARARVRRARRQSRSAHARRGRRRARARLSRLLLHAERSRARRGARRAGAWTRSSPTPWSDPASLDGRGRRLVVRSRS